MKEKENIFIQTNYEKDDMSLSKYGCFFLSLCYLSQLGKDPILSLETKEDILKVAKDFQQKGYLDKEFFVNNAPAILKDLTGNKAQQLTLSSKFGVMGRETYFPVLYPVEKEVYEIICYRNKENMNLTHFSLGKTSTGEDQEVKILFNTLGGAWLKEKENLWFASDKRVFRVGEK